MEMSGCPRSVPTPLQVKKEEQTMHSFRFNVAKVVATSLLASTTLFAGASRQHPASSFQIGPSTGQIVGAILGIAGVGAAVGIGVYYATRHHQNLTGCTLMAPDGLRLESDRDDRIYSLTGVLADIKAGDRVRVSGKKQKVGDGVHPFLVEKLSKDFGPCKVQPETR